MAPGGRWQPSRSAWSARPDGGAGTAARPAPRRQIHRASTSTANGARSRRAVEVRPRLRDHELIPVGPGQLPPICLLASQSKNFCGGLDRGEHSLSLRARITLAGGPRVPERLAHGRRKRRHCGRCTPNALAPGCRTRPRASSSSPGRAGRSCRPAAGGSERVAERFGRAGWHIGHLVAGRRFHLRRVDRPPPRPETGPLGVPFQPRDETMKPTSSTTRTPRDPDAAGRGWRAHHQLQNRLAKLVRAAGWSPRDPAPIDPEFDLAWGNPPGHRGGRGQELHQAK